MSERNNSRLVPQDNCRFKGRRPEDNTSGDWSGESSAMGPHPKRRRPAGVSATCGGAAVPVPRTARSPGPVWRRRPWPEARRLSNELLRTGDKGKRYSPELNQIWGLPELTGAPFTSNRRVAFRKASFVIFLVFRLVSMRFPAIPLILKCLFAFLLCLPCPAHWAHLGTFCPILIPVNSGGFRWTPVGPTVRAPRHCFSELRKFPNV